MTTPAVADGPTSGIVSAVKDGAQTVTEDRRLRQWHCQSGAQAPRLTPGSPCTRRSPVEYLDLYTVILQCPSTAQSHHACSNYNHSPKTHTVPRTRVRTEVRLGLDR
jgi:hypothetical protein